MGAVDVSPIRPELKCGNVEPTLTVIRATHAWLLAGMLQVILYNNYIIIT
jgi:hypothetical protein